MENIENYKMTR